MLVFFSDLRFQHMTKLEYLVADILIVLFVECPRFQTKPFPAVAFFSFTTTLATRLSSYHEEPLFRKIAFYEKRSTPTTHDIPHRLRSSDLLAHSIDSVLRFHSIDRFPFVNLIFEVPTLLIIMPLMYKSSMYDGTVRSRPPKLMAVLGAMVLDVNLL